MPKKIKSRKPNNWLYSFACFLLRLFFFPVYRMEVRGRENIPPEGPIILCSNHVSVKDPIFLGVSQKRQVFYMAKEELFKNPIAGTVLKWLGAFPVNRGSGGAEALSTGEKLLRENAQVGIFIEGTRSKTGALGRPKTGAAYLAYKTGAPILPACVVGQSGKLPLRFQKTIITFGKPISKEELGIPDETSLSLRRASRKIMASIAELHREARVSLGLPQEVEESA